MTTVYPHPVVRMPVVCNQCKDAKCMSACPTDAIYKRNGVVRIRYDDCIGCHACVDACPFGAIKMANGLPVVDSTKCTSCGRCVKACPRNLYSIKEFMDNQIVTVACSSTEKGVVVKAVCGVGCIVCKVCEKLSGEVFKVDDNLARVYYDKATPETDWNKIITKCPTKVIAKVT